MIEATDGRPLRADAARNRERVLAAAAAVFARYGLASTLDQVAERAGVGVGTVYRRFTGRDELVQLVFAQRLDDIAARLETVSRADDPWSSLVGTLEQIAAQTSCNRGLRELVESSTATSLSTLAEVHERVERALDVITARAIEQGTMRPGVGGADIGVLLRCMMTAADLTEDDGWRRYLAVLLDGLRNRPDSQPLPCATMRPKEQLLPRQ